jgi:hypothetical protein
MKIGQPEQAQNSFATVPLNSIKFGSAEKPRGARSSGASVASSSSLYGGRPDYY